MLAQNPPEVSKVIGTLIEEGSPQNIIRGSPQNLQKTREIASKTLPMNWNLNGTPPGSPFKGVLIPGSSVQPGPVHAPGTCTAAPQEASHGAIGRDAKRRHEKALEAKVSNNEKALTFCVGSGRGQRGGNKLQDQLGVDLHGQG